MNKEKLKDHLLTGAIATLVVALLRQDMGLFVVFLLCVCVHGRVEVEQFRDALDKCRCGAHPDGEIEEEES